jgi:hypothetical protein
MQGSFLKNVLEKKDEAKTIVEEVPILEQDSVDDCRFNRNCF